MDSETESLQGVLESSCGKELGVTESQTGSILVSLDSCQVNNYIFLVLFAAMLPGLSVISSNVALNCGALARKYSELSAADAIQADCDVKATNIILQGLPPEVYVLVSNHQITKELWERIQLLMQGTSLRKQERECKLYDEFDKFGLSQQYSNNQSSTPLSITYPSNDYQSSVHHNVYSSPSSIPQLEYASTVDQQQQQPEFPQLDSAVVTSRYPTTNNELRNLSNPRQQATINDRRVTLQPVQGRQISFATDTSRTYTPGASGSNSGKQRTVSSVVNHSETKITSDSNIIPYSLYVKESQQAVVQNSISSAQQDALILSVIEQLKTQFFYDHTTKQALGFQNLFYLKKAQQLEPKLYDGNVIKNTSAIVISNSEETLMLAKGSRSKMLLKQQNPMVLEKKNSMNSSYPSPSCRPTKVEVLKEVPKVSMVYTSLKKLKHHLACFNVVVKERTIAAAIIEGS
ncbi:hypothetical protein Tco_0489957 [Tanacetum coccineum]